MQVALITVNHVDMTVIRLLRHVSDLRLLRKDTTTFFVASKTLLLIGSTF